LEHLEHVVDRPDPAADRERHEDVVRDRADRREVDLALLGARLDVVEDDLVDLVLVELLRELLGGRDVDVVLELLRFRHPPVHDVEARDEPFGEHQTVPSHAANRSSSPRPMRPLFSAWNCVATMLSRPAIEQKAAAYSVNPSTS